MVVPSMMIAISGESAKKSIEQILTILYYLFKAIQYRGLRMALQKSQRKHSAPAGHIALHYLKTLIDELPAEEKKLPPVAEMARAAGVSIPTMSKAIQACKKSGQLLCTPGQGIFVARAIEGSGGLYSVEKSVSFRFRAKQTWMRVSEEIEKCILNGEFRSGMPLPIYKELRRRFGVSYATLRKSLQFLCARDVLQPYKKGYIVHGPGKRKSSARIALLMPVEPNSVFRRNDGLDTELLRMIEKACAKAGVSLRLIGISGEVHNPTYRDLATSRPLDLSTLKGSLGVIKLENRAREKRYSPVMNNLNQWNTPLAVLDIAGEWNPPSTFITRPHAKVFRISLSHKPGKNIAHYLLKLHHRTIAYISPFHRFTWSKKRLEGLQSVYAAAGIESGVYVCTSEAIDSRNAFFNHFWEGKALPWPGNTAGDWWAKLPLSFKMQKEKQILYDICDFYSEGAICDLCIPLFDKALSNKAITALVACNDSIASMALSYLKTKNIEVPEHLSLIGFDDSLSAFFNRITSYSFNIEAIADAMLNFLLRPDSFTDRYPEKIIDIGGEIVVRESCTAIEQS
ncbi:MAG: GntR family transcriptional regulator [Chitinivibrionales bacterium]|nr:GntR family transcriptional regulator [Chitinivibrionales bacterium]